MFDRTKKSGFPRFKLRKRKGITMVIMLIFVPLIMIVAASYVEPIVRSYRASVNDQKTLLAKAVADSMFELALWESRGGGTGSVNDGCICQSGSCDPVLEATECEAGYDFGFGTATGQWHVYGTPEEDNVITEGSTDWYTVPSLGSGDAGGDYCSTADPVVDTDMLEDALVELGFDAGDLPMSDPFDWPCHWDKIREGESVVIPLFTEDENGVVSNPVDLGLSTFELRFRAACDPADASSVEYGNTICADSERYVVEGDPPAPNDTVIVLWEIVGDEVDTGGLPTGEKIILGPYKLNVFSNSNIRIGNINNYKIAMNVIKENSPTKDNKNCDEELIGPHLINIDICPNTQNIHRPYLNLLVVHTLREDGNPDKEIPYLEYQFKAALGTPSASPISSTSKVVKVDVMVNGGYSETLERTIALPKPISGFVISQ